MPVLIAGTQPIDLRALGAAVLARLTEAPGDSHFYGSWKGGSAKSGGGPAGPEGIPHTDGQSDIDDPSIVPAKLSSAGTAALDMAKVGDRVELISIPPKWPGYPERKPQAIRGLVLARSTVAGQPHIRVGTNGKETGEADVPHRSIRAFAVTGEAQPGSRIEYEAYKPGPHPATVRAAAQRGGMNSAIAVGEALVATLSEKSATDHFYGAWKGGRASSGGGPADSPEGRAEIAKTRWADHDALIKDMSGKWGGEWDDIKALPLPLANCAADTIDTAFSRYGPSPNFQGVRTPPGKGPGLLAEVKRVNPDVPGSAVYLYTNAGWNSESKWEKTYQQWHASPTAHVSNPLGSKEAFGQSVVMHELGHQYMGLNLHARFGKDRNEPSRKEIEPWFHGTFMPQMGKAHVSQYARSNPHEAWAELFASASGYGQSQSHFVPELKGMLDKHYPPATVKESVAQASDASDVRVTLREAEDEYMKGYKPRLCGWAQAHPEIATEAPMAESGQLARALIVILEKAADDHFYGSWRGGGAASGGGPASEVDKQISSEADTMIAEAAKAEPGVTALLQGVADETGGSMHGLEFRLKEKKSLTRKMRADMHEQHIGPAQAAAGINDHLRYTILSKDENAYGATYTASVKALAAKGYTPLKTPKSFWGNGAPPPPIYQGVNAVFANKSGQRFELQFHTPQSIAAKEATWPHYSVFRETKSVAVKRREFGVMATIQSAVRPPSGWPPSGMAFRHGAFPAP